MRIALAQINPTVGDIAANTAKIIDFIGRAAAEQAELVIFPELSIIGYPPKDLLLKPAVIAQCDQALLMIAARCTQIAAIVGYPTPSDAAQGRTLYNAAAVCVNGQIVHRHVKSLLPTYDVFDEHRYFEPGPEVDLTEFNGVKLGISVCEDLWNDKAMFSRQLYHDNPIDRLAERGAQWFINCSASPFFVGKHEFRVKLFASAAKRHGLPLVYVNQVGGNDELIFDGRSAVVDVTGKLIAQAKGFEEDLLVVDMPASGAASGGGAGDGPARAGRIEPATTGMAELFEALVLGVRDYCAKCGFKSIVLGLSGGIDSAVTAAIAAAALGPDRVTGITMPSRYSSGGSKSDAQKLAENLGIAFHTIPIASVHDPMEKLVTPHFQGLAADATEENLQARLRGVILMSFSNKFGSLLVTTGNKSEMAVGYCTLYGDMAGGLAVISDVPKTMVYQLAKWINAPARAPGNMLYEKYGKPVIPPDTITKPPSAELRPDQTDQDTLPPYELLDDVVHRYVEREQSVPQIITETGYDAATVQRIVGLIDRNEYKRKQAPPGLKVTGKAFGFGRRMPIAMRHDATGQKLDNLRKM